MQHGQRHVWTGAYGYLDIFREDKDGELINEQDEPFDPENDEPLLRLPYFEGCTINSSIITDRRAVTGRPHKRIVRQDYEYVGQIENLYVRKSEELNFEHLLNREQFLRMVFKLYDNIYLSIPGTTKDIDDTDFHTLTKACAGPWSISSRTDQNVIYSLTILAEEFF